MSAPLTLSAAATPWDPACTELPLTLLDRAFARFLAEREPSQDPRHAWLAALASHQLGRGHACLDLTQLDAAASELLAWDAAALRALPARLAESAATLPWCRGVASHLVLDKATAPRRLYLRRAWLAEQRILARLAERQVLPVEPPAQLDALLDRLFPQPPAEGGTDWQRQACASAARHRFTVITGGPGTGKTTTVVRLIALLAADARARGRPFVAKLAAPTGKAASRLSQSIAAQLERLPAELAAGLPTAASTLHKLLGVRGDARDACPAPLAADLVVVDEASMVDLEMMARLLDAVPVTARLVLLGDKDQLASVEAGAVLSQLCERPSLQNQIVTLQVSHRFTADSGIGRWASRVNAGDAAAVLADFDATPAWSPTQNASVTRLRAPSLRAVDLDACVRAGWSAWRARLAPLVASQGSCSDAGADALLTDFAAFQVLAALREGPWGVAQLNARIARCLGFTSRETWYAGRPVLLTRNDYALGLMNGDIGLALPREGGLRIAFRDMAGALRWVLPSRLEDVETVFAMTVHKSQGSEFRDLLLVLPDTPSPVLTRELLYTGITRAMSRLTLLAPSREVLRAAIGARVSRSGGLAD
jgi:exodeoxyribonuclease V alpha subunit